MKYYNNFISEKLKEKGINIVGFADLSKIDYEARRGFKYGIVIAKTVDKNILKNISSKLTIDYYNEVNRLNDILKENSRYLEKIIINEGFNAFSQADVKQDEKFTTPLPFKTIATNAGLGWIGKSATLITEKYGNAIRLNTVLTDMPFICGTPITESKCGSCTRCRDMCPSGAIKGNLWNVNISRNNLIDPKMCKEKVIERGRELNILWGSCDKCLTSCPYTIKYINN